jgi:hypothetical protein
MDYREMFDRCRQDGKPLPVDWEEYTREAVKKRLEEIGSSGKWQTGEELLWIFDGDEKASRGLYRWNPPDGAVAVAAPPVLMAVMMGEYDLAVQMVRAGILYHMEDMAVEQGISRRETSGMVVSYMLWDIWFLDADMSGELYEAFLQGMLPNDIKEINIDYLRYFPFAAKAPGKNLTKGKLLAAGIKRLRGHHEEAAFEYSQYLPYCVVANKYDEEDPTIWEPMFEAFETEQQRSNMTQFIYGYFCYKEPPSASLLPNEEKRLMNVLKILYQYDHCVEINDQMTEFMSWRIGPEGDDYVRSEKRQELMDFMELVPRFEGTETKEWKECVARILKTEDRKLLCVCFHKNFLKLECLEEYMDYAKQCSEKSSKAFLYPFLVSLKWRSMQKGEKNDGKLC